MTQPLTQRHQRRNRRNVRTPQAGVDSTGRADHRPITDDPVLETQWRLEVTFNFDDGGAARRAGWPEC